MEEHAADKITKHCKCADARVCCAWRRQADASDTTTFEWTCGDKSLMLQWINYIQLYLVYIVYINLYISRFSLQQSFHNTSHETQPNIDALSTASLEFLGQQFFVPRSIRFNRALIERRMLGCKRSLSYRHSGRSDKSLDVDDRVKATGGITKEVQGLQFPPSRSVRLWDSRALWSPAGVLPRRLTPRGTGSRRAASIIFLDPPTG